MPPGDFLPRRGKVTGLPLVFEVERELMASDLLLLATDGPPQRTAPPQLQQVRAIHHQAPRLVAQGLSDVEVALRVGRTAQRIGDLRRDDPAFKHLVSVYAAETQDQMYEDGERIRGRLVDVAEAAVIEIQDRIDDPAQRARIPIAELRQVAQLGLDRTVAPPKKTAPGSTVPQQITFNIGNKELKPVVEIEGEVKVLP